MLKTKLNSINTLKRYSKATSNVVFNKKMFLMMTKNIDIDRNMIDFLSQPETLLLNMLKLIKNLGFYSKFL